MQTFEEFLSDKCESHTNNSPEGFENWLADMDGEDMMEWADIYGRMMFTEGKQAIVDEIKAIK